MQVTNITTSYLNENITLSLDYDKDIKSKIHLDTSVNHSILSHHKQIKIIKKLNFWLLIVGLAFLLFVVTPISIIRVRHARHDMITPGKSTYLIEDTFDKFFAYGPRPIDDETYLPKHPFSSILEKPEYLLSYDILLKMNMFDDEGISKIKDERSKYLWHRFIYNDGSFLFNLYMGIKDGKDIILLRNQSHPTDELVFESIYNYSFSDIINRFEDMINEKLSDEFLNNKNTGIYVDFYIKDEIYMPIYVLEYNSNIYKIDMNGGF